MNFQNSIRSLSQQKQTLMQIVVEEVIYGEVRNLWFNQQEPFLQMIPTLIFDRQISERLDEEPAPKPDAYASPRWTNLFRVMEQKGYGKFQTIIISKGVPVRYKLEYSYAPAQPSLSSMTAGLDPFQAASSFNGGHPWLPLPPPLPSNK